MTREEAKEKLYMEWQKFLEDNIDYAGISEAYKMAFKALEQEPFDIETYCKEHFCVMVDKDVWEKAEKALKQEPCEEAISRQAVLEMAYDMSEIDGEHFTKPWMVVDVEDIQNLPSVRPQNPKTGHWVDKKCSVCGCKSMLGMCIENYCANCGAKMESEG